MNSGDDWWIARQNFSEFRLQSGSLRDYTLIVNYKPIYMSSFMYVRFGMKWPDAGGSGPIQALRVFLTSLKRSR